MRAAAWALTAVSAVLWSLAGAATWAGIDPRALDIEVGAAVAATTLTGACLIAWAVRDREKQALTDALADFTLRRASAPTRPEQRLRLVGEARPR